MPGTFVISLDFELHWGVRDHTSVERYRENLLGVREAIPALLGEFERRGIRATWATVGALFCSTKAELASAMPSRRPCYEDARLDPYDLSEVGEDEESDPFHFAPSLIERIAKTRGQEIGTHTFSHFYCLERGQTADDFDADLAAARKVSSKFGDDLMTSIIFPRNQLNRAYWPVLVRHGVKTFRSNGVHWAYAASTYPEPPAKRAFRLLDTYVTLSGSRTSPPRSDGGLVDVPASAFLRPWSRRTRHLERLRQRRIRRAMTRAAEAGTIFHLWWHPHNFGRNLRENMSVLANLLDHFEHLRRTRAMQSATMRDLLAAPLTS